MSKFNLASRAPRLQALCAVAAVGLLVPACDGGSEGQVGRVEMALAPAPADSSDHDGIRAAGVVVSQIYLQGEGGRTILRDTPVTVDLMATGGDVATLVDARVPDGTYGELRLVIDGAWVAIDGESGVEVYATPGMEAMVGGTVTGELKTPSWDTSGLKVKLDGALEVDGSHRFLALDFDVAETFQTRTGAGAMVMSPVVKALDVELTTAIEVRATFAANFTAEGPVFVELRDSDGFVEGIVVLADADGDGVWTAGFELLDPNEGPFTATVIDGEGVEVTTSAGLIAVVGESGATVDVDVTLIALP